MFLPHFSTSDFSSLFDLEHDLPDELISSSDLALPNGGVEACQPSSLGPIQDTATKHKQLSELLCSTPQQQQQQAGMMSAGFNRPMMAAQKGNGQAQGIMGGQAMNGVPRMGYVNANAGMNMADPLQQQQLRAQQPAAVNKVKYSNTSGSHKVIGVHFLALYLSNNYSPDEFNHKQSSGSKHMVYLCSISLELQAKWYKTPPKQPEYQR